MWAGNSAGNKVKAHPGQPSSSPPSGVPWNREILFLFGATFLAYANISVFFSYVEYLRTLAIEPRWFGLLIAVFSAVSLLVRPVVSLFLHHGNAYRTLFLGTVLLMATLCSYSLADGFWTMLLVRAFHGLAFVLLGTALMTMTVEYIPGDRSAQFFGFLSVIVLVPNTVIPPLMPFLINGLGGFPRVLFVFAGVTGLMFPLVLRARSATSAAISQGFSESLDRNDLLQDLRNGAVISLLLAMLLLYSGCALVFFFLDGFGRHAKISGTGFFLTLSTAGEIGVRVMAGSFFDKINKARLAALTMITLALAYAALGHVRQEETFFCLGLLLGLGWGIAMPVYNGLMFDLSEPKVRAFNTNLGFQMFQGGFFLGPLIGAPVVTRWGFTTLFEMCAVFSFFSAVLTFALERRIKRN